MKENVVYIVKCSDNTYYTGWTNNIIKRIQEHNSGNGAKYTKPRRPVTLVYLEKFPTKEEAMKREYEIKQLKRVEKQRLVDSYISE
jgi:Predicted endonuclease containing a URI domain